VSRKSERLGGRSKAASRLNPAASRKTQILNNFGEGGDLNKMPLKAGFFTKVNSVKCATRIAIIAVDMSIIIALSLVIAMILTFPAVSGAAGPSFVDDFSRPSDAWRFGNAVLSNGRDGLVLNARH